ncbi:MAG: hypothetical protein IPL95_02840 [Saprospiraceae bacterium]|nr:hypothetical protein [Saprospiraceae bacterium]
MLDFHRIAQVPLLFQLWFFLLHDPCANENHSIINVTPVPASPGFGFEYRYSIDGGAFVANSLPGGVAPGPHCFSVAVFATTNVTCDGVTYSAGMIIPNTTKAYCLYFGTAPPVAIPAGDITANTTCQTFVNLMPNPNFPCFTYEYQVDNGSFGPLPINVSPGCHTLQYRLTCGPTSAGFFGCASNNPYSPTSPPTTFSIFDDLSKIPDANITINRTCSSGANGTITSISGLPVLGSGLSYEYSVDGLPFGTSLPTNLSPGCHYILILQRAICPVSTGDGITPAACIKQLNFVVYPTPPVIAATSNECNAMFTLPNVPAVGGFTVEYELDGSGTWSTAPSTTTPGCHSVRARYVLSANCGSAPFNIIPSGSFSDGASSACTAPSAPVSIVIFPAAPVLTAPDNTCNTAFALPSVVPSTPPTGFTLQWSIDGGVFTPSPIIPTTPGCHNVRAQYALTADCGATLAGSLGSGACGISNQVNVVIFPTAPIITAPSNTCASAFSLPAVAPIPEFTVEYSINGGTFAASPVLPTTPSCYSIVARYVLSADCGATPQNVIAAGTAGSGLCGNSNTVNVVIFPNPPTISGSPEACNGMFGLPSVAPVTGFNVEYELDNSGSWSASPSISSAGCHPIRARYVLAADCLPTLAGATLCGVSNQVQGLIRPLAPIILSPANSCNSAFALPVVTPVAGFTVQYKIINTTTGATVANWLPAPIAMVQLSVLFNQAR